MDCLVVSFRVTKFACVARRSPQIQHCSLYAVAVGVDYVWSSSQNHKGGRHYDIPKSVLLFAIPKNCETNNKQQKNKIESSARAST